MSRTETNTPLHIAVLNNRVDEVRELLKLPETECNALNHREETPLFLSLKNKCSDELILTLIDHGVNVQICNKKGTTPLHLAVQRRSTAVVTRLIEEGASVNLKDPRNGCTPLHIAIAQGRLNIIQEIFRFHNEDPIIDTDTYYPSLLYFGLERKCCDKILFFLMDLGEDIDLASESGTTPLLLALNRPSRRIPHKLILNGADLDVRNRFGLTYMHEVILKGDLESVCMLLFYGADVTIRNTNGKTAFEQALTCSEYQIAYYLMDFVADFNEKGDQGFTTLHLAIRDCPDIVPEIIEKGADVNVPWFQTHCIHLCIWWHFSSNAFRAIWPRIDFEIYAEFHDLNAIFNTFVCISKFPRKEFLKCMYLILDSERVQDFLDFASEYTSVKHNLLSVLERDLSLDETIEVIWVLLSYGVEVYFNDVCFLYEMYGFDECLEMILMSGCCIYPGDQPYLNPLVSKICYNNFNIYTENIMETKFCVEQYIELYSKYYKVTFNRRMVTSAPELCNMNCVKSLVQLSRDVVRDVIYKTQSKKHIFNVYQAFSQLPIPLKVRDILFLKRAIY